MAAPVTVFHGPNEAGKTTFAEFIRTVLFGFPRQGKDAYIPLFGGKHGGRLEIVSDDGKGYTFERYRSESGRSGTPFTVVDEADEPLSPEVIDKLCAHRSREAFKEVYAFELDDLVGLKSDEDIYSAGAGASRLPETLKELGNRQSKIFKAGGKKQEVALILGNLDELEKKLRVVENQAASYAEQTLRRDELVRENEELDKEQEQRLIEQDEKKRLQAGWSCWTELQGLKDQLSRLPVYKEFPDKPTVRLDQLEREVGTAGERVTQLDQERERLQQIREAQITGETLAANDAEVCKKIQNGVTHYEKARQDLPGKKNNLGNEREAVDVKRATLGSAWTDDLVKEFETSIAVKDRIAEWKERLDHLGKTCEVLEHDAKGLASKVGISEREVTLAESKVAEHPCAEVADSLDDDLFGLSKAKLACAGYDSVKASAETMTESPDAVVAVPLWQQVVGGLLFSGLILGAASFGMDVSWVTVTTYGAAIGIAVLLAYVLFRQFRVGESAVNHRTQKPVSDPYAVYQTALKSLEHHFPDAALVGLRELEELQVKLETLKAFKEDVARKTAGLGVDRKERDEKRSELANKITECQKEKTAWEEWLTENAFPDVLSPGAALTLLMKVDHFRQDLLNLRDLGRRVRAIEKIIEEHEAKVSDVVKRYRGAVPSFDAVGADTVVLAERIQEVFASATTEKESQRRSVKETQERIVDLEDAPNKLAMKQATLDRFIEKGGTTDLEKFRRRATQHEERQALEEQVAVKQFELRAPWNVQPDDDRLAGMFSSTIKEQVDRDVEDVSNEVGRVKAQLAQNQVERGRVLKIIEGLEGDEQASQLRQERAVLEEQLRVCAEEWAVVTVAKSLLAKAQDKHERERQPDVVKAAEKQFAQMTGQRYQKVIMTTGGDRELQVEDESGIRKTDKALSRGTRDQLYLSLRFGLIQTLGRHDERLPVIVDDVLVTSDRTRAAAAVKGFVELSKTNQVLVLTCHDWVVDLFKNATKDLAIVPLP